VIKISQHSAATYITNLLLANSVQLYKFTRTWKSVDP